MSFPVTAKYFLRFRHSDTGLLPVFTYFKRTDTLVEVTPQPDITEVGGGTYYFEWSYASAADPDIVFEVDGTSAIPTEEMRYISDTISPRDYYIDTPVSTSSTGVWEDTSSYGATTKGGWLDAVKTYMGLPADASTEATVFGKILKSREMIRGDTAGLTDGKSVKEVSTELTTGISDIEGSGFSTSTDSLKILSDNVDATKVVVDAIKVKTDLIPSNLSATLTRILGLLHENTVLSDTTFDGNNNLTSGTLSLYSDADGAENQTPAKLLASYTIYVEYAPLSSNVLKYTVTLNP